jgi:hypothetical protein
MSNIIWVIVIGLIAGIIARGRAEPKSAEPHRSAHAERPAAHQGGNGAIDTRQGSRHGQLASSLE